MTSETPELCNDVINEDDVNAKNNLSMTGAPVSNCNLARIVLLLSD